MKAKHRKQSVARGRGPSSAPPPPRAPSPAPCPGGRAGAFHPPCPLPAPPHEALPPSLPPAPPPSTPPEGPARRAARFRARPSAPGSRNTSGPARPRRSRRSLSLPRTAAAPRPGEFQPRRGGRGRGWGADGAGAAAIPPTRRGPRRPRHPSPVGGAFLAGAVIVAQIKAVALGHGDGGRSVCMAGGRSVRVRRAGALRSLPERRHGEARPTKWRPEGSAGSARGAGARTRWPKPPLGASPARRARALPRRREGSGLRARRESTHGGVDGSHRHRDGKEP